MFDDFLDDFPVGKQVDMDDTDKLKERIVKIYEFFSKKYVSKGGISANDHKKTFVIFTDYDVSDANFAIAGSAMLDKHVVENCGCFFKKCYSYEWGNAIVLFKVSPPSHS